MHVAVVVLLTWCATSPPGDEHLPSADDHLEPGDEMFAGEDPPAYRVAPWRALFDSRDATGRVRLLQMVEVPSFEVAQAVYLERVDGGTYVVFAVEPGMTPWMFLARTAQMGGEAEDGAAEVLRWGAPIPSRVAERLIALWTTAVNDARRTRLDRIVLDGTTYHFAAHVAHAGYRSGKTIGPSPGSRVGALVRIGKRLAAYARALDEERPGIEQEILAEARALEARFRTSPRGCEPAHSSR